MGEERGEQCASRGVGEVGDGGEEADAGDDCVGCLVIFEGGEEFEEDVGAYGVADEDDGEVMEMGIVGGGGGGGVTEVF